MPPNGTLIPVRAEVFEDARRSERREPPGCATAVRVQYAAAVRARARRVRRPGRAGRAADLHRDVRQRQREQARPARRCRCRCRPGRASSLPPAVALLASGVVTWNLGTIPATQIGTRQLTVNVGALADGSVVRASAQIQDSGVNAARASSVAVVQASSPLAARDRVRPRPAAQHSVRRRSAHGDQRRRRDDRSDARSSARARTRPHSTRTT